MEFFIPSLLIFLVAMIVSFAIIPRLSPLILAVLAAGLLSFGVYHHYNMFKSEYRLSTWQEGIKIYAPAIMIIATIIFIILGILSFFTGGKVPIPSVPNVSLPTPESATNTITSALNNAVKSVSNVANNVKNAVTGNNSNKGNVNNKANKNLNGISRSALEVI